MKSSHLTTPRTMNECIFMLNADPIERPHQRDHLPRWVKWLAALFIGATLFALTACGTPRPTCQDSIYGCNGGGARATAAAKPSAAPAPSKPSKPGKPGGHHGGKPGHGK